MVDRKYVIVAGTAYHAGTISCVVGSPSTNLNIPEMPSFARMPARARTPTPGRSTVAKVFPIAGVRSARHCLRYGQA